MAMVKEHVTRKQAIRMFAREYAKTAQRVIKAFVEGDKPTLQSSARTLRMFTDIMAGRRGKV